MSGRATHAVTWAAAAPLLLHLDFWRPQRAELYLGWMPEGIPGLSGADNSLLSCSRMILRALAIALIWAGTGCGQPAAIYEAAIDVGKVPPQQNTVCNDQKPCPQGMVCFENLCQPQQPVPGADVWQPPPDVWQPPIQDTNQQIPDTVQPPPDPGPQEDTGPPDPPPTQCTLPGKGHPDSQCTEVLEVCRINPDKTLTCSGSVGFGPYNSPCTDHTQCDILFGCHNGKCTTYCELQFGSAQCFPDLPNCKNVGHPSWGACGP